MDMRMTIYPWLLTPPATLLFKSLLVFAAAGLLLLILRRASAAARHLVCLLTLGAVLALPFFSLSLPVWHLPVLATRQDAEPTPVRPTPIRSNPLADTLPVKESGELGQAPALAPHPVPTVASYAASATASSSSSSSLTGRTPAKQGGGFFLYLLGLLLASARPLLGLWGINRLSRACTDIDDEPALTAVSDCARLLGLPAPRLCRATILVPMTWGWRCPVIVLPSASADWPDARLRSVLLHEMAHVKRRDWPGHRLADFACALLWFYPLVWLTARRLRAESELACDDLVLASGIPAPDYARHLLEIASALPRVAPRSAAIAMAQTSQIESRIAMILDSTRRRTLPRRALIFSVAVTAAALVPLAMLRPAAKAQTTPAAMDAVQLIGIAGDSAQSGAEWDQNGNPLPVGTFTPPAQTRETKISAPAGQKALFVAFRVPTAPRQSSRIVVNSSNAPLGRVVLTAFKNGKVNTVITASGLQMQLFGGPVVYLAGFPAALTSADFQVGIASDTGSETVDCPKTVGKVRLHKPAGDVIFTLFPHPQGGAVFMVSDHFRRTSTLKADNSLQAALHDSENYERSVYTLDKSGKVLAKLLVTPNTWPDSPDAMTQDYRSIKTQQTGHLSSALLRRTALFRLVARPYQWTEFKNVALQPSASPADAASGPEMATERLHRIYGLLQTYRRTHEGAFPSMLGGTNSILTDLAVHPKQYGLPDAGANGGKQAGALFSLPDTTQIVYFLHDKRPDGTPVGTAKQAGTRDVFAYTGLYVSNHPHGATGYYLVLWDDGTVDKIPVSSILTAPSYDVIGPPGAAQQAARQGLKQIAFPGQAGLPQN